MAKEEWGVKRLCPTTGKRFYDLNRDLIISPYTGEVVEMETPNSKSSGPQPRPQPRRSRPRPLTSLDDDDDVVVDDEVDLLEDGRC